MSLKSKKRITYTIELDYFIIIDLLNSVSYIEVAVILVVAPYHESLDLDTINVRFIATVIKFI